MPPTIDFVRAEILVEEPEFGSAAVQTLALAPDVWWSYLISKVGTYRLAQRQLVDAAERRATTLATDAVLPVAPAALHGGLDFFGYFDQLRLATAARDAAETQYRAAVNDLAAVTAELIACAPANLWCVLALPDGDVALRVRTAAGATTQIDLVPYTAGMTLPA